MSRTVGGINVSPMHLMRHPQTDPVPAPLPDCSAPPGTQQPPGASRPAAPAPVENGPGTVPAAAAADPVTTTTQAFEAAHATMQALGAELAQRIEEGTTTARELAILRHRLKLATEATTAAATDRAAALEAAETLALYDSQNPPLPLAHPAALPVASGLARLAQHPAPALPSGTGQEQKEAHGGRRGASESR